MSRGEERKKLFKEILFWSFVVLCSALIIFLLIPKKTAKTSYGTRELVAFPFSELKVQYSDKDELSIHGTIEKKKLFEFVKGLDIKGAFLTHLLPENLNVSCVCGVKLVSGEKSVVMTIKKAEINGFALPPKLLTYIGEIDLDFKRSLVYN